jgi:large subunit ribosomal protein L30
MAKQLHITQVKSGVGTLKNHKATLRTLGLKKIGQTVVRDDSPEVQGMVRTVAHLVKVEEA